MHIKSLKHSKIKVAILSKKRRESSIVKALKSYDRSEHPVGETLPDTTFLGSEGTGGIKCRKNE